MKSTQKYIRTSPRKLRLVADAVRNLSPEQALNQLKFLDKNAALAIQKALKAAIANARVAKGLTADNLAIKTLSIGEGPTYKRWRAVSRGSAHSIMKRTSHINIELKEKDNGSKS